jgi:UDP-2,3-diacylglucosamine pyrophosphatase LpxH
VRARYRSIFLSDVHLGSPRSQAELLLDFLEHHRAEYLFLVGDIADDTAELPPAAWPPTHRAVLEALRQQAREGTRVHYMHGNHDPLFAELWGQGVALEVARELEHTTADGRRIWIVHGEDFDGLARERRWLARLGDALASALEAAGVLLARLRRGRRAGLGRGLKQRVKGWLGYVGRFERSAVLAARARSVDGIICGHVHAPASRTIDGLYYGNGGDWVGSATALVERDDGGIELLTWERAA